MKKLKFQKIDEFMSLTDKEMSQLVGGDGYGGDTDPTWTAYSTTYNTHVGTGPKGETMDNVTDTATDHTLDYKH